MVGAVIGEGEGELPLERCGGHGEIKEDGEGVPSRERGGCVTKKLL